MPNYRSFRGLIALGVCVAFMAWLTPAVHAAPIFSFSDSPSPTPITSGSSTITLTGQSGSGQNAGFPGGANEFIMNINLASATASPSSDPFNTSVSFPLTITDTTTGFSQVIPFTGTLSGSLNSGTSSVFLTGITPSNPITFNLGFSQYTVNLTAFPQPLTLGNNQINVNVSAVPLSSLPEPPSLALWGVLGMAGVWYGRRRFQEKLAV